MLRALPRRPRSRPPWSRAAAVLGAVGAVVASPAALSAQAQEPPGPSVLTVRGAHSAQTLVTLARDSIIEIAATAESPQVTVSGDGRVAGLVLQSLHRDRPFAITAVNFNLCGEPDCSPLLATEFVNGPPGEVDVNGDRRVTVPAGDYRVVLLADGAEVSASLQLQGLASSVEVSPVDPYPVRFRTVQDVTGTDALPAMPAFSGGYSYTPPFPEVLLFQELYRTAAGAATTPGTCIIYGPPPPGDLYGPFCPTADLGSDRQQFVTPIVAPVAEQVVVAGYGSTAIPGQQTSSLGHYLFSATPVISSNVTQVEVPLLPAPDAELAAACPPERVPDSGRKDADGNTHELAIDCMIWWEIAKGTSDTTYTPAQDVTREQMASFVARLIEQSGGQLEKDPDDAFTDDGGPEHNANINRLAAAGIVDGRADGSYAPREFVSRGQMAKFLVNAYGFVSDNTLRTSRDYFSDDDDSVHEANINKAAEGGFTKGRPNGNYEPNEPVRRDQMAAFLARTLDRLVTEGTTPPHE